jgi:hypothetical protein
MGIVGYTGFAVLFVMIGLVFWEAISLRRQAFADISTLEQKVRAQDRQWEVLKTEELHSIIQQQDAMIAVLWHNAIGLRVSDAYPPDDIEPTRFGVAPPWTIISRWSESDPEARQPSLSRNVPYPWSPLAAELSDG